MKLLLKTIKALADGNRLRIIRLLMDRPRCVCELQKALAITQPSVSKHLRILEEAGLVDKKRSGQFIDYLLAPPTDPTDQRAALMSHLIPWLQIDPELTAFSQQAQLIDRQDLCRPSGNRVVAQVTQPEAF
jgi:ArsR family transcriptional regulator